MPLAFWLTSVGPFAIALLLSLFAKSRAAKIIVIPVSILFIACLATSTYLLSGCESHDFARYNCPMVNDATADMLGRALFGMLLFYCFVAPVLALIAIYLEVRSE